MTISKTKSNNDSFFSKIAVNKSICKEYKTSEGNRTVYLNDGDEFQIQLFNPETVEIGVEIKIDGTPLSNTIILNPGERLWLERYTDKAKKFRFNVYTVDGESQAVQEAISKNGVIELKFYRKRQPVQYVNTHWTNPYSNKPTYPWNDNIIYCSDGADMHAKNFYSNDCTTISTSNMNTCFFTSEVTAAPTVLYSCGTTRSANGISDSWASIESNSDSKEIETGRTGAGSHSSQKFQDVDIDLEYFSFRTETFKILPKSRKPYTASDAKKIYCSSCGHKLNTKFKFCPYCGAEVC